MRCARCGTALDSDAKVCSQCGAVVGASYGPAKGTFGAMRPAVMSTSAGHAPRLTDRVRSILRSPRAEWAAIAAEATTPMELLKGYVMPLAAIGAAALFVAQVFVGMPVPLIGVVRASVAAGLAAALLMLTLAVVNVYVMGWAADTLAPRFGGERDRMRALKLAAYSYTPIWLAGVLYAIPQLAVLWLAAAAWGLFLLLVGLPALMRCRGERTILYAIALGACALALSLVQGGLVTAVTGAGPALFD